MQDNEDYMLIQIPGNPGLLASLGLDGLLAGLGLGQQVSYAYVPRDVVQQKSLLGDDVLDQNNDTLVDGVRVSPRLVNLLAGILG
jgi:hypothetical protein